MHCRTLSIASVGLLASLALSQAQTSSGTTDPKTPAQGKSAQPSTQPPNIELRDGVYWIGPKKQEPPKTPAQPGRGGRLFHDDLRHSPVFANVEAIFGRAMAWRNDTAALLARLDLQSTNGSTLRPAMASKAAAVAQAQAPVVRQNRYVIQFKPNATAKQRSALLSKYGLVVKREMPDLNIVVVEGSAPAESQPKTLADIFNPPIIQSLRREPIVANATVDSAASPRVIPRPSETRVTAEDGSVHHWSWSVNNPAFGTSSSPAIDRPLIPDGNWGLKALRMPPVWTILQNHRAAKHGAARPKLGIIDTGFSKHPDLAVTLLPTPNVENADAAIVSASAGLPCDRAHGNHVAGIAAAIHGNGVGIDGIIPDARVDAVPVTDNIVDESVINFSAGRSPERLAEQLNVRWAYFSLVLEAVRFYVSTERSRGADLRVVNVSMGFNIGKLIELGWDPDEIKSAVRSMLQSQAQMVAGFVAKYEDSVLFVVAAGNDSEFSPTPHEAKWGSPLAWLAKGELQSIYRRPKNILVVEAVDRSGQRAVFSNIAGHVAAPGVEVLSTLAEGDLPYFLCQGTSQAAPHAAAVATLMFELSPSKKPAEIIDIMIRSARPKAQGSLGAPRLDALEAVLRLSPYADSRNEFLVRLADLNGDGKVDILDMREFARQLAIINDNRANGTTFSEDLNGDQIADAHECHWPAIDFNGSGAGSVSQADARRVLGEYRNDLAVMQLAWTDRSKDATAAIKETGLDAALLAADARNPRVAAQACR